MEYIMLNTCQLDGISLKKFAIYFAITGKYSIFALVIGSFWTIRAKNQFCIQFVTSTIQEPVKYLTYRGLGVIGSHPSLSAENSTIYVDVNRDVSFLQKSTRKQAGNRHARNSRKTRAKKTVNVLNETVYPDPHVCAIVGFLVICDRINSFRAPGGPINR